MFAAHFVKLQFQEQLQTDWQSNSDRAIWITHWGICITAKQVNDEFVQLTQPNPRISQIPDTVALSPQLCLSYLSIHTIRVLPHSIELDVSLNDIATNGVPSLADTNLSEETAKFAQDQAHIMNVTITVGLFDPYQVLDELKRYEWHSRPL